MLDYRLEHLLSYSATLKNPPEVIGPLPEGIRANFYVTGGKVEGPKINGTVLPSKTSPALLSIRMVPRYHTAHPEYLWLNRIQCLGIGQADMGRLEVRYDVYAIR